MYEPYENKFKWISHHNKSGCQMQGVSVSRRPAYILLHDVSPIIARLKFCIFVIVQSAKSICYNCSMNFEINTPVSDHTISSSQNPCDMNLKPVVLTESCLFKILVSYLNKFFFRLLISQLALNRCILNVGLNYCQRWAFHVITNVIKCLTLN